MPVCVFLCWPHSVLGSGPGKRPTARPDAVLLRQRRYGFLAEIRSFRGCALPKMNNRISGRGAQLCSCRCHWDLSWLRFGDSRIAPCDVNGMFVVERAQHFLFIETKTEQEPITQGQRILLEQISCIPKFTVLLIRGPKSHPTELIRILRGRWSKPEATNREEIQRRIDSWFEAANRRAYRR